MKIKVIVTGATGMVGEGVMHECLNHPAIEEVLIVNRRPSGFTHPKLKEIIHKDFFDLSAIESQLSGYQACFFCLGVSSVGMKEPEYHHLTYDLTLHVAQTLCRLNNDMVFTYVSGAGTDGKMMWAKVKKKTEDALMKLPFKKACMFRPGFMKPTKGLKNTLKAYKYMGWLYPVLKALAPNSGSLLSELGLAMIAVATKGDDKNIEEVKDIIRLAKLA